MKEMLTFGTKNVHYTCDGKEFAQINSIAMEQTFNFYKHLALKTFELLVSTLFPYLCKISRPYLVSVPNY